MPEGYEGCDRISATIALGNGEADPEATASCIIHPAALDNILQLALLACHSGQIDRLHHAYVPVRVDSMTVWKSLAKPPVAVAGHGAAKGSLRGIRGGYA